MKTVTGLFDNYSDASAAVGALESAGVKSSDISIVSHNADDRHADNSNAAEGAGTGAGIGAAIGGTGGLLTGLGLMAIPGVGPVVAAGWLAATAAGAVAGAVAGGATGGIIGAMTSSGVTEDDAHVYAEGVRRGGTLVTAKVEDTLAPQADEILKRSNLVDPTERRAAYQEQGWTRFDDTLDPYPAEEIEQERNRYRRTGAGL
ncbi:hypothetical protein M2418_004558 [Rhizobium sp. BIGb0125]|jgi:hypothetical protein|uniref:general stress protein n=1 Tax=Rhizobium sp. BIGb0125 TaxID=2940618 RepID=UPI002167BB64|nr:general stress protein [Rhizobium sp. BIGb0125]MCS4245016.1 hypothetical protein [Rhizobium sp. BIGb0125]